MVNFLNKILSVLPDAQKISIKSLIAAKTAAGELTSIRSKQEEASTIYSRIKSRLSNILLNPKYAIKDEKISSSDHNDNMEDIFLDLNALYTSIDDLSKATKKQIITLNSDYQKSRASVEKLINDVKVYSLRKRTPEFNDIKLIDFNSSTNQSKKEPIASINPNVRVLELKPLITARTHIANRTSRSTKVYTKTYSSGLKSNLSSSFPPENIVDQKSDTFWATMVLSDSPVSQLYQKNTSSGSEYQLNIDGPVVEVYFKFSHTEKINTIKILPFSEFPIKIIDISYRPSQSSQIFYPIVDFKESTTLDWEEYNFYPVLATEVKITIAQENYKKISYLLPKAAVNNTDLFQKILNFRASKIVGADIQDSDFSLYLLNSLNSYESAIKSLQKLYENSGIDSTVQPNIEYYDNLAKIIQQAYSDIAPDKANDLSLRLSSNEPLQQPGEVNININKYEYLLGLREVEINYQVYYPTSYYESEKFLPEATVSEIQIEVDERHTTISTEWQNDYQKTSTEWDLDIGNGRKIPIHPKNIKDSSDNIPTVKDERIDFNLNTNKGYTRLGGYYSSPYRLKKNGDLVPSENYTSVRITGSIPRIEIDLSPSWFDVNSIYTIDYAVDPSSYSIDILDKFNSQPLPSPEVFTEIGSDNDITLSKYPFINYEVINLTGFFQKEDSISEWKFIPPQANIFSGQLLLSPTILDSVGNIVQTGSSLGNLVSGRWGDQSGIAPTTLSGNPNLSLTYFGDIKGVEFGYFLKIMDSNVYGELSRFNSASSFILKQPIIVTDDQCRRWDSQNTGAVFSGLLGSIVSGSLTVNYSIGIGVKSDDQIFAISDILYSPIEVTVGTKKAKNITNYETLVHPAFSISNSKDHDIEYIHAGKKIYFNQKFDNQDIRVSYNWVTEYIKVIGTLKFNGPINPDLTPKVNEVRIFSNNLVI